MIDREEFVALWKSLLDYENEPDDFDKKGQCYHFGKQERYYLTDKLYGVKND